MTPEQKELVLSVLGRVFYEGYGGPAMDDEHPGARLWVDGAVDVNEEERAAMRAFEASGYVMPSAPPDI